MGVFPLGGGRLVGGLGEGNVRLYGRTSGYSQRPTKVAQKVLAV